MRESGSQVLSVVSDKEESKFTNTKIGAMLDIDPSDEHISLLSPRDQQEMEASQFKNTTPKN